MYRFVGFFRVKEVVVIVLSYIFRYWFSGCIGDSFYLEFFRRRFVSYGWVWRYS